MSDVFLGVIAASVLVMAVIQLAALAVAARLSRRLNTLASTIEREIRPAIAHLQAAAAEAARGTAIAAAQVERVDGLLNELGERIERMLGGMHQAVSSAGRFSGAWLVGLKTMLETYRELRDTPPTRRPAPVDEEDSLFIG